MIINQNKLKGGIEMLNQNGPDLLTYLTIYLPNIMAIIFNIIIVVFAILMYKRNSYKYGITLMISSIILLASDIIYLSIQYPLLSIRLKELGLSVMELLPILMIWRLFFLSLYTVSAIFLVVSIYLIYKTHKKDRID
jgi:heme/copper-type cytochrome/quinol oxidase subunit 2